MNVSAPNSTSITFYADSEKYADGTQQGDYFDANLDTVDPVGHGEFDITAGNGTSGYNETITVTNDRQGPTISSKSPEGVTSDDSPTISYTASDDFSEVDNNSYYIAVYDDNGDLIHDADDNEIDVSGLSEEEHKVGWEVQDSQGNTNSDNWTFTVDTTADFELGLSSGDFSPEPGTIEMDEDQDVDITLEDFNEDGTAYCLDGDDEIDSEDVNDGEDVEFTCEFNEDDYGGTTTNVEVEVCDEVDNCVTSDDSYEFMFDQFPPTVSDLETDSGASSFKEAFNVNFDVTDDVSEVENVEYYFDDFVNYGEANSLDYNEGTSVYSIDPSSLESGEHSLKIRAEDSVGRWSSAEELEFSYYPDRSYSLSLGVPENMTVTSGDSESFTVEVENDGEIFVPDFSVEASSDFYSESQDVSGLTPDESVTLTFEVSPAEEDIGRYEMEVASNEPSTSESFNLIVEANEQQKEEISSNFQEYSQKLDSLQENVTALKRKGLSEERNQRLDANFSNFKDKVEEAESAVESGDYYRAEEVLSSIEQDYSSAQQTYSQVQKEEKRAQTRQTILMALLGLVVLVSSGIGYVAYSDRYELDAEAIEKKLQEFEFDIGGEDSSSGESSEGVSVVEKVKQKLNGLFEGGSSSEAEDYSWEGFENN